MSNSLVFFDSSIEPAIEQAAYGREDFTYGFDFERGPHWSCLYNAAVQSMENKKSR